METLLLEVIAEKTGYPAEAIGTDLDLEADLGIDSIKRVEILSAMRERMPKLPEVEPAVLGSLSTLAQIVSHLGASGGPVARARVCTTADRSNGPSLKLHTHDARARDYRL